MRAAVICALVIAGVSVPHVAAQTPAVRQLGAGRVTVTAMDAPLGQLLRELAGTTNATLRIDPAVEGRAVSLDVEDVSIEQALSRLLRASDVDYVAVGLDRTTDAPIRIVVGDPRAAGEVVGVTSELAGAVASTPARPQAGADPGEVEDPSGQADAGIGIAGADGATVPGQVSPEEFLRALSSPTGGRVERRGDVMLPFADAGGRPLVEHVGASPRTHAMLPFVDDAGQPIVAPAVVAPEAPVMLPFSDAFGGPMLVPAAPLVPMAPGRRTPGQR